MRREEQMTRREEPMDLQLTPEQDLQMEPDQTFDTVAAFPTLITELTQKMNHQTNNSNNTQDPVVRALECLPPKHSLNVKRKLERAIHEETLDMDEKTRTKFFKLLQEDSEKEQNVGIAFHVGCRDVDGALKHTYPDCNCLYYRPIFTNESKAARALMEWIQKNKFQLVQRNESYRLKTKRQNLDKRFGEKLVVVTFEVCLEIVRTQSSLSCYDVSNHLYDVSFSTIHADNTIDLSCGSDADEEDEDTEHADED